MMRTLITTAVVLLVLSSASPVLSDGGRGEEERLNNDGRSVIEVDGGAGAVVWVVQLSDLHFSVHHPERALDFRRLVGPALAFIKPALVLITGDLTDGKSKDLLIMKQNEKEWMEYQNIMKDVVERSGLDKKIFFDLRGNHDNFGVPEIGGAYDFYSKYSINSDVGRTKKVQSVTLKNSGWKHLFVGFDSTMDIGLRGPTNLFGHPSDELLLNIDLELSQWDSDVEKSNVTKISFGHFPISFSAGSDSGRNLKDVFLKHSLSAYLCGHLHSRFGKNLKRHHLLDNRFPLSRSLYQLNIHEGIMTTDDSYNDCSKEHEPTNEFWEWEMGDWRKSRAMRILAIDAGHVSFLDTDLSTGAKDLLILPIFPLDSRFMQRAAFRHDYNCQSQEPSFYETVRALIFSELEVKSVSVKVYDRISGDLNLVMDSTMRKRAENVSRGSLYMTPWNWRAFIDPSPDRYWLKVEAVDVLGRSSSSELRPFSINGLTAKIDWRWTEFLVMGFQWASLYPQVLWLILPILFSAVLIPCIFLMLSSKHMLYINIPSRFSERRGHCFINWLFWLLLEFPKLTRVWSCIVVYLLYVTFLPWFFGHVFTEPGQMAYMTLNGWTVPNPSKSNKQSYMAVPDIMVIVLPHLGFVVLPAILVMHALAAEKASQVHYISFSDKKQDDYNEDSKMHSGRQWFRKLLLLGSLAILWKHWKQCRSVMKAYEINPLIHSPIYCFLPPLVLCYTIYRTASCRKS